MVVDHGNSCARELPKYGGLFVQCEDEIASVSIALGCSYAGHLAVTGSAGPGISLKMEALGWASMAEMPLSSCNVQRGGPSTGMPTNVEQSDLHQAIFGSHGDSPRVVLAPTNVEDCFYIAIEAARIARKYSTPVFILTDMALATRIEAFDEPDLSKLMVDPKPDLTPRADASSPIRSIKSRTTLRPARGFSTGNIRCHRSRARRNGPPDRQPEAAHGDDGEAPQEIRKLAEEFRCPKFTATRRRHCWSAGDQPTARSTKPSHWRAHRAKKSARLHLRHLHPLPNGLEEIFAEFKRIVPSK